MNINQRLESIRDALHCENWSAIWTLTDPTHTAHHTPIWDYLAHHMGLDWCYARALFNPQRKDLWQAPQTTYTRCDLRGAPLDNLDLSFKDFRGADLRNTSMHDTKFIHANLIHADLRDTNIRPANFFYCAHNATTQWHNALPPDDVPTIHPHANLSESIIFGGLTFKNIDLSGANLTHTDLFITRFNHCLLPNTDLSHTNLDCTDFQHTSLQSSLLDTASISTCTFTHCDLRFATIRNATLRDCTFSHTNLTRADLSSLRFERCTFTRCDLSHADLSHTYFNTCTFQQCTPPNPTQASRP